MPVVDEHSITVNIADLLDRRGMTRADLAQRVGITEASLYTIMRSGPTGAKGIRFSTLTALCRELECGVGDLLTYSPAAAPV